LVAAKRRGQKLGRQFALTPDQVQNLKQMVKQGMTVAQVGPDDASAPGNRLPVFAGGLKDGHHPEAARPAPWTSHAP
jgi:hypothetical protein